MINKNKKKKLLFGTLMSEDGICIIFIMQYTWMSTDLLYVPAMNEFREGNWSVL